MCISAVPVRVPFELHNHHIYLRTTVNGSGPYWFLFDTGAGTSGTMIDSALAAKLKIEAEGSVTAGMIGGSRGVQLTGPLKYKLGSLVLDEPKSALLPLADQAGEEGHVIDGIFGYSLISRYVVEIDYRRRVLTFHDPSTFKQPRGGVKLELIDLAGSKVPTVNARVTTTVGPVIETALILDTGYDGSLLLGRGLIEQHHLEKFAETVAGKGGAGLGGSTSLRAGHVAGLAMGSLLIKSPVTDFAFDEKGAFAANNAYLGGAFLRRFRFILNYSAGYVLLI